MTKEQFEKYQEQTFDSFCKAVIRNESIDAFRELAHRREHEIALSSLSASQLAELQSDGTFHPYRKSFFVSGCAVEVRDASLGEILQFIPSYQRDVVLLSYFLGYTDLEISKILRIKKSTIHYRRNAALRRLRHMLEVMGHE